MQLYGLKTCDTCRKALKALPNAEFRDVRTDGVPDDVLSAALAAHGDAVLNKRSKTWASLDAQARSQPALDLIKAHPALMKRPLIVAGGQTHIGWSAATEAAVLGS